MKTGYTVLDRAVTMAHLVSAVGLWVCYSLSCIAFGYVACVVFGA